MPREIKFRAWDKTRKIMRPIQDLRFGEDGSGKTLICNFQTEEGYDYGLVNGESGEFMQFTGLKDKNGKEIYEGDIAKCINKYDEECVLFVRWITHLAGFYYVDQTCKEGEWMSQIAMFDNGEEVIGNIYENPELLK